MNLKILFYLNKIEIKFKPKLNDINSYNIYFVYIKAIMLGNTMKVDILARLTPQESIVIYHQMKTILTKKKQRKYKQIWGD